MESPIGYIKRTETFSAAHRLHSPLLSAEENERVYGKCNWPHGHGHNYTLTVVVKGSVDKRTGMIMNLSDLKEVIKTNVTDLLDHRNLDKDVPFFADCASTSENLAIFVWKQLEGAINTASRQLYEVVIDETNKNTAVYRGE